jgi:anti-sigma B factor antagonist
MTRRTRVSNIASRPMTTPDDREPTSVDAQGIKPPAAFAIEYVLDVDGAALLVLRGELDLAAAASLRARVEAVVAPALVVDLEEVTFFDSSALRELLYARHVLEHRGAQLVLAAIPRNMRRLLDITGTSELFDAAPTRQEALERVAANR